MKASELRIGNYIFTPELNGVFKKTNEINKLTIVESVDAVGINFFQTGNENEYDHWDGEFENETIKPIFAMKGVLYVPVFNDAKTG